MEMTKEEFQEWRSNKTTQKILDELREEREELINGLGRGASLGPTTGEATAHMVGYIRGLDRIVEIEYEEGEEDSKVIYEH